MPGGGLRCINIKGWSNGRDAKRSVHLNPLTTTTLRKVYVQSLPETRSFFLIHAFKTKTNALTDIRPEVAEALHARQPAISLEFTVITHNPIACFTQSIWGRPSLSRGISGIEKRTRYHRSHRWTCQNWTRATRARTADGTQE